LAANCNSCGFIDFVPAAFKTTDHRLTVAIAAD
jgi:hypothetical protein